MHNATDLNYYRGYEWRLMAEARRRNPAILLSALAWAFPGWVGGGSSSPWTHPELAVTYIVNFLKGARDVYNTTIDFVDSDMNERGWNAGFVKLLRTALDAAGFSAVRIVCGDDARTFSCASSIPTDPVLAAAVYAIGSHNPSGASPSVGKPLWGTELEVADPGGTDLAVKFSELYISQNVTGFVLWNALTAYYEGLFAWDQGIFRAFQPWSGFYELCGRVWVFAHYTQATRPGMRFLAPGFGSGSLTGGGTYLTLVDPATNDVTLILNKPDGWPENATFTLTGPGAGITSLHVFHSTLTAGTSPSLAAYYIAQPDVTVTGGVFSIILSPGDLVTVTTVAGGNKGAHPASPPSAPFPTTWSDNFDACPPHQEAAYWADQTGSWECVPSGGPRGVVMQQVVPMHPIAWRPDEQRPVSVIGSVKWTDTDIAIDVMMPGGTDGALLGARANPNCCTRVITGEDMMPGVWWQVSAGTSKFTVWNAIANVTKTGALLTGTLPLTPVAGTWYNLRLAVVQGVALPPANTASMARDAAGTPREVEGVNTSDV